MRGRERYRLRRPFINDDSWLYLAWVIGAAVMLYAYLHPY